jgi:hypothetical protein
MINAKAAQNGPVTVFAEILGAERGFPVDGLAIVERAGGAEGFLKQFRRSGDRNLQPPLTSASCKQRRRHSGEESCMTSNVVAAIRICQAVTAY